MRVTSMHRLKLELITQFQLEKHPFKLRAINLLLDEGVFPKSVPLDQLVQVIYEKPVASVSPARLKCLRHNTVQTISRLRRMLKRFPGGGLAISENETGQVSKYSLLVMR